MSNCVYIQRTVFTNYPNGNETYGYRMYDNTAQIYNNNVSKEVMELPPEKFLKAAVDCFGFDEDRMFDYALDRGYIDIDGEDYKLTRTADGWEVEID